MSPGAFPPSAVFGSPPHRLVVIADVTMGDAGRGHPCSGMTNATMGGARHIRDVMSYCVSIAVFHGVLLAVAAALADSSLQS